jgi:hypothetical protein
MITGEIKNRIDSIWDTYWVGGTDNDGDGYRDGSVGDSDLWDD